MKFPVRLLRFALVGAAGFVVDAAVIYALRETIGLYAAGVVSFFAAASCNWALNRAWTFRDRRGMRAHRQWLLYLVSNLIGFLPNRGMYFALVALVPYCAAHPVWPVAMGALAGLMFNFILARSVVFR